MHILSFFFCGSRDKIFFFKILQLIESSKKEHLFETEIFCNMINVTTDEVNTSLLNKSITFFKPPPISKLFYRSLKYIICINK